MEDWDCDWEVLHDSRETPTKDELNKHEQQVDKKSAPFSSYADHHNTGVFGSDYFSIDSHHHHHGEVQEEQEEGDNPTWIDPSNSSVSGGQGQRNQSSSSNNSDSSEITSDSRKLLYSIESPQPKCDYALNSFDNSGEKTPISTSFNGEFSDAIGTQNMVADTQKKDEVEGKEGGEVDEVLHHLDDSGRVGRNGRVVSEEEERENEAKSLSNEKNKKVVWWRVPLEVLRYCVLRMSSPVWSLSMAAAAVMGFIILRRRYLYKMKCKTQGLQLKVTVDDKKVSQFMSRAAQLNEAFSVVKRVPIIRPSLQAPGLARWPVVIMR